MNISLLNKKIKAGLYDEQDSNEEDLRRDIVKSITNQNT